VLRALQGPILELCPAAGLYIVCSMAFIGVQKHSPVHLLLASFAVAESSDLVHRFCLWQVRPHTSLRLFPPFSSFEMTESLPLPSVTGSSNKTINILLINPNGTSSMTDACLRSLESTLPPHCTVTGFTAPHPTPSAIEGHLDGILSAAAAIRAVAPIASRFDAFLVACFSAHPLINALREAVSGPVIGIMEAALYSARMLGGRLGVVATGGRSKTMHEDAIRYYGLEGFSVGCETTNLGVLELERLPRDKVLGLVTEAARMLVQEKGADCIALGCAGMTEMKIRCEEAVGAKDATAQVIDGVGIGVQILIGLVREGHVTAKGGIFRSAGEGRKARGQDWL
jgi:Asp/Glu/hydantoin racemase